MGQAATKELTVAQDQVRILTSQLKQSAVALASTRAELAAAKTGAERSAQAYAELQAVREKLELMSGELKVAEAEKRAVERLRGELEGAKAATELARREKEALNSRVIAEANARLRPDEHPIFGALMYDHGFKKVYRASPTTVWAATPIWERQRAFRQDRSAAIAKAKSALQVRGWPGTITVCELVDGEGAGPAEGAGAAEEALRCVVVDGQHRLGAAHMLAAGGGLHESLGAITVELYPKMTTPMVQALFTEINKVQAVKLVDLPVQGASDKENAILSAAVEDLKGMYKEMFKPSPNCRPPHVNVDTLRDELHRARVVERLRVESPDGLLRWLLDTNARLEGEKEARWEGAKGPQMRKAADKAAQHRFFLGMDSRWIQESALVGAEATSRAEDPDDGE